MKLYVNRILQVLMLSAVMMACSSDDICLTPTLVTLRGNFVNKDTSGTLRDSIQTNALWVFGSSLNYAQSLKNTSSFAFPLSQIQDSVIVYYLADSLNIVPEKIDTLRIKYTRQIKFISNACGYQTWFTLNEIAHSQHSIDSVRIATSEVSNDANSIHIKVILKQ